MFIEELTKINESETYAEDLQKKAKTDSRQSIADAKTKAEQAVNDAKAKAKEIYDTLMKEGQAIADEQYERFLSEKKAECSEMIANAKNNEDKAIELIAERIVRNSVNS